MAKFKKNIVQIQKGAVGARALQAWYIRKVTFTGLAKTVTMLIVFVVGLWVSDRAIAALMYSVYSRITLAGDECLDDVSQSVASALAADPDVYIFGDSRAVHHYDPEILQQLTGLSYYNAGADGQRVLYYCALAELILRDHHPKAFIVNINYSDFELKDYYQYDRLHACTPYLDQSPTLLLNIKGKRWQDKTAYTLSQLLRFNGRWTPLWRNWHGDVNNTSNGFVPLRGAFNENGVRPILGKNIDEDIYRTFRAFVKLARIHNVQVILSLGPYYYYRDPHNLPTNGAYYLEFIRHLAVGGETALIEIHSDQDLFFTAQAFKDAEHLNAYGARYYSQLIAGHIKRIARLTTRESYLASIYRPHIEHRSWSFGVLKQTHRFNVIQNLAK